MPMAARKLATPILTKSDRLPNAPEREEVVDDVAGVDEEELALGAGVVEALGAAVAEALPDAEAVGLGITMDGRGLPCALHIVTN